MISETVSRLAWKIRRVSAKALIRISKNPRPASYPFISGDGFRALADHVYDEAALFDPVAVKEKDIVFMRSSMIDEFFLNAHPLIAHPYILITHNDDWNIRERECAYMDDKIIHWFAQNALVRHEKITPIPIGLENAHYANAGVARLYPRTVPSHTERNGRILAAFNPQSNPGDRLPIAQAVRANPLVDWVDRTSSQKRYVDLVTKYTYVVSPPGNGEDCHRTWEALYLGVFPFVRRSACTEYFKSLGLPLILVDDWSNLPLETPGDQSTEPLYFEYWKQRIMSYRLS